MIHFTDDIEQFDSHGGTSNTNCMDENLAHDFYR